MCTCIYPNKYTLIQHINKSTQGEYYKDIVHMGRML